MSKLIVGRSVTMTLALVGLFLLANLGQASANSPLLSTGGVHTTWARSFSAGSVNNLFSVQQTRDGGFVTAGLEDGGLWVLRLNPNGRILWQKNYGAGDISSVHETQDRGFIVSSGGRVLKLDSEGNIVWQKFYYGGHLASITEVPIGGYVAAGNFWNGQFGSGMVYGAWLLRLDSQGSVVWQKIYGQSYGPAGGDTFFSVERTNNGGFVAAGWTPSLPDRLLHPWIVRVNATGSSLWQKAYQDYGNAGANSVQQTADGGYIVAADNHFLREAWIFKLDSSGNMVWQKGYSWGTTLASAAAVAVTRNRDYVIAGYVGNYMLIVKLDSRGNQLWYRTFGGGSGDLPYALAATRDGGFIAAGDTFSYTTGISSAWLVKLNSKGICCPGIVSNIIPTVETTHAVPITTNAIVSEPSVTATTTNIVPIDTSSLILTQCSAP